MMTVDEIHPTTALSHVKAWLRARLDDGTVCPACNQTVKMYRRKLHARMAEALLTLPGARHHRPRRRTRHPVATHPHDPKGRHAR